MASQNILVASSSPHEKDSFQSCQSNFQARLNQRSPNPNCNRTSRFISVHLPHRCVLFASTQKRIHALFRVFEYSNVINFISQPNSLTELDPFERSVSQLRLKIGNGFTVIARYSMVIERLNGSLPSPPLLSSIYETQRGVIVTKFSLSRISPRPRSSSSRRKRIFYNGQNSRPIYANLSFFLYMRARTFRFDQFRGREIRFFEKIERG